MTSDLIRINSTMFGSFFNVNRERFLKNFKFFLPKFCAKGCG